MVTWSSISPTAPTGAPNCLQRFSSGPGVCITEGMREHGHGRGGVGNERQRSSASVDIVTVDLTRDPRWEAPQRDVTPTPPRRRERTPALRRRPALILLVDDNADNRELFRACLESAGFRVIEAIDGQAAIERALSETPDVIVMDVAMPVMNGYLATRLLKGDLRTHDIPIAIITAGGRVSEHEAASAGCDAFLVKPCPPEELDRVVTRLALNRRRGRVKPHA